MQARRIIKVLLLVVSWSLHGQQVDYEVGHYFDRHRFLGGSTLTDEVLYSYIDLRLVNQFELEGRISQATDPLDRYIALEQRLGFHPFYHVYSYVANERVLLRNSTFTWTFDSIEDLVSMVSDRFGNDQFYLEDVPFSMIRGGLYYHHSETLTNNKAVDYLNNIAESMDIQIGQILPAENGYTIELLDGKTHRTEWYLYAREIKDSIFPSLRNKYELSAIFNPGGEISQESYSEWQGTDSTKLLIYGEINRIGQFQVGDTLQVLKDTLTIYQSANLSADLVGSIGIGEELNVIAIGKYGLVNGIGGDWIHVETSSGSGWCFASPFDIYYIASEYVG